MLTVGHQPQGWGVERQEVQSCMRQQTGRSGSRAVCWAHDPLRAEADSVDTEWDIMIETPELPYRSGRKSIQRGTWDCVPNLVSHKASGTDTMTFAISTFHLLRFH